MSETPKNTSQLENKADKDLETYLQGDTEISTLYQSSMDQEPPAALDQFILSEAAKAVATQTRTNTSSASEKSKPGLLSRLFSPANGWLMPAASLASFAVVAVVVTVMLSEPNVAPANGGSTIATLPNTNNGTQTVSNESADGMKTPATPELWLKHIVELHGNGKKDAARTNLALFRAKYPNYSVDKIKKALSGTGLIK